MRWQNSKNLDWINFSAYFQSNMLKGRLDYMAADKGRGIMNAIILSLISLVILSGSALAGDVTYTTHIKQLFEQQCGACHGSDAPEHDAFRKEKDKFTKESKGPRMDSYTHLVSFTGWPYTGALMRRLDDGANTKDRKPGNMYQYLGADDTGRQRNLGAIHEWVGSWSLKRWTDVTKEDLSGIKIPL